MCLPMLTFCSIALHASSKPLWTFVPDKLEMFSSIVYLFTELVKICCLSQCVRLYYRISCLSKPSCSAHLYLLTTFTCTKFAWNFYSLYTMSNSTVRHYALNTPCGHVSTCDVHSFVHRGDYAFCTLYACAQHAYNMRKVHTIQTFQLARFHRETHYFRSCLSLTVQALNLTVSRPYLDILLHG